MKNLNPAPYFVIAEDGDTVFVKRQDCNWKSLKKTALCDTAEEAFDKAFDNYVVKEAPVRRGHKHNLNCIMRLCLEFDCKGKENELLHWARFSFMKQFQAYLIVYPNDVLKYIFELDFITEDECNIEYDCKVLGLKELEYEHKMLGLIKYYASPEIPSYSKLFLEKEVAFSKTKGVKVWYPFYDNLWEKVKSISNK